MQPPHARFTDGSLCRHVLTMVGTCALSLLSVFLVDILTLVYVSRLKDPSLLAAVGLGKTLVFLDGAIVSGVVIAAGVGLSARIGRQARESMGKLVFHLLLMAVAVAGLVAMLEGLWVWGAIGRAGDAEHVHQAAQWFIWLSLVACLPFAAQQMCAQLLRAAGDARRALLVLLSSAIALAVADPLFIFVFDGGVAGAGLAYLLSACAGSVLGLVMVRRSVGLSFTLAARRLRCNVQRTARIAVPAMVANLAMPVGITYLMFTLAQLGDSALAGMAVVDRVLQLGYCVFFAVPTALVPIIAQNLGAGRRDRAHKAVALAGRLVLLYGTALWVALLLMGPPIADCFMLADAGRSMFIAFTRFGAGLWIVFGLDFIAQSLFLTLGQAWWVPAFGWLRGTLGTIPFVYIGAHEYGGVGALAGMWLGNALVALLAIATAAGAVRRYRP